MFFKILFLAFFVSAVTRSAEGQVNKVTVTAAPAVNTTTPLPTTTTAPTTTPKTTTVAPSTSTESPPNTTTAAPTTSTVTPATSTAAPVTTTAAPPKALPWYVRDNKTGVVCLLAQMDLTIDIPYNTTDNKVKWGHVEVAENATASGSCSDTEQMLVLSWDLNRLQFNFTLNETQKQYWTSAISANISVTPTIFPNISDVGKYKVLEHLGKEFATPLNKSYMCETTSQLNSVVTGFNESEARLSFKTVRLDAFHNNENVTFSPAVECENGQSPDIVPIVVGCALAALVIVVLIAYLVGRRRSQARGYLSM